MTASAQTPPPRFDRLFVRSARGHFFARPTLSLFLYSNRPARELAPHAASAIEAYLEFIGPGVLKTVAGNNGELREFTQRKLARDLKQLRDLPASAGAVWVEYDSDPDGWVGEYGVYLYATDFGAYEYERSSDNLLRFDLPPAFCEERGTSEVVQFMSRCATLVQFESGNAGLALKRTSWTKGDATAGVNSLLPRYLALDPCYSDVRDVLRGHTTWAHWINFLSAPIIEMVGGVETLQRQLEGADIHALGSAGLAVRNCEAPPLGDVNRRTRDLGLIPDMARLLAPSRVPLSGLGDPVFDVASWLARFDQLEAGPFGQS